MAQHPQHDFVFAPTEFEHPGQRSPSCPGHAGLFICWLKRLKAADIYAYTRNNVQVYISSLMADLRRPDFSIMKAELKDFVDEWEVELSTCPPQQKDLPEVEWYDVQVMLDIKLLAWSERASGVPAVHPPSDSILEQYELEHPGEVTGFMDELNTYLLSTPGAFHSEQVRDHILWLEQEIMQHL